MRIKHFYFLVLFLALALYSKAQDSNFSQKYQANEKALQKLSIKLLDEWKTDSARAVASGFPLVIESEEGTVSFVSFRNNLPVYVKSSTQAEVQSYFGEQLWSGAYNVKGTALPAGMWEAFLGTSALPNAADGNLQSAGVAPSRVFTVNAGTTSSHANNVALRLAGDGSANATNGLGIAKEANIYAWDVTSYDSELALNAGSLLVSNHSYSEVNGWTSPISITLAGVTKSVNWWSESNVSNVESYNFGRYSEDDGIQDLIAYLAPYHCIVKSAGNDRGQVGSDPITTFNTLDGVTYTFDVYNSPIPEADGGIDGFDCLPSSTSAKNIFIIGACQTIAGGYSTVADVQAMSFSAFGPTDDGRIKPDFVAPGPGGTSYSAPNVSGSIMLLQELSLNTNNTVLRSSTIKALLAQTAFEAGNAGPDYKYGWGLINPKGAADVIINTSNTHKIIEDRLPNGESRKYYAYLSAIADVAITISWTDPDGTPISRSYGSSDLNGTTSMLVNDLNITLKELATATISSPYVLNPASPNNVAITGTNTLDNIEKIDLASAPAGWYEIEVSHMGSLIDENGVVSHQDFGLVMSGFDVYSCLQEGAVSFATIWESGSWSSGLPSATDDVLIADNFTLSSSVSLKNLVIKEGVQINLGAYDLTVNGSLISEGNVSCTGTGSVVFAGGATQKICGYVAFENAEVDNTSGIEIEDIEGFVSVSNILLLTDGSITTNSRLELESTADVGKKNYAQIHNTSGSVVGNIYFENTIQGNSGWRNIASPVSTNIGDILEDQLSYNIANNGGSVYKWDAASSQWVKPTDEMDAFNATTPYTAFFGTSNVGSNNYVFNSMPFTARVFGAPNDGAIDNTLAYHNGSGGVFVDVNIDGWNLIANPYPENLDWTMINGHADFTSNINGSYYIWDANQNKYLSHNGAIGDSELGGTISPMQAFYVKLNNAPTASTTAFDFTNNMRTTGKAQFLKTGVEHIVLSLKNQSSLETDKTYISFDADASLDFDTKWDAFQLKFNPLTSALVYTGEFEGSDSTRMAINTLPLSGNSLLIPVFVEAPNSGLFTISIDSISIDQDWSVELINISDSISTDLRLSSFSFNYSVGDESHRFWLVVNKNNIGIENEEELIQFQPKVWVDRDNLNISLAADISNAKVRIRNMAGQLLYDKTTDGGPSIKISKASWVRANGLYFIEVEAEGQISQSKVLIAD